MQKKIMAAAVAGALALPAVALAQTSTVQVYGTLVVNYNVFDQGGGKPKIDMLNSHDANIGFRGEEKLGGNLSAWFQCESTMDVTGNEAGEKGFCGRNSGIGFKGGWGNVFYGQWDTPMKVSAAPARPWSTSGAFGNAELLWNGSASNVGNGLTAATQGIGTGGTGTQTAGWSRRQANSIFYHSPSWGGFGFQAAVSTLNESTAATNATVAQKPRLWSLGGMYSGGNLYVGAGYEKHKNYNPASQGAYTGGNDSGWNLSAAYTFAGVFKLSGVYTDIRYDLAAGLESKRQGFGIYGDWAIAGPHRVRMGYTKAKDTKGSAGAFGSTGNCAGGGIAINSGWCANGGAGDTGADLMAIQYAYAFSKRTEVNFGYARLDNDRLARYALQTLSRPANAGENQDAWVLGVKHTF